MSDKEQAINSFWNSFDVPAYDENTVPATAGYPHITYNVQTDSLDNVVDLYASLWYKSTSWKDITLKAQEIEKRLGEKGGVLLELNVGYAYITKGTPFMQRMADSDDSIRRIYFNINVEYLTPW